MCFFNKELCMAMLSANIPFHKLKNQLFCKFLEKYTNKTMPDEYFKEKLCWQMF